MKHAIVKERISSCPFCGGDGMKQLHPNMTVLDPVFFYSVECQSCFASTFPYHGTWSKALSAWNDRKLDREYSMLEDEYDKLKDMIKELLDTQSNGDKESYEARMKAQKYVE